MALSGDFISASFATTGGARTWITLLNYTGKGMLNSLMIELAPQCSGDLSSSLRVTIDGNARTYPLFDTVDASSIYTEVWAKLNLPFSASLKIEIYQPQGSIYDTEYGTWTHYYSPYYIKYIKEV